MNSMHIRCAMSSVGCRPRGGGQICPHSAPTNWRALTTHLPQDNPRDGRPEAIGHRVGLGGRRQCAAWDPSICPSNQNPWGQVLNARASAVRFSWMLTPAHSRAPSHSLTGIFRGQPRAFFINDTYRKHERRLLSGYLWPRAAGLRARAHAGGVWPCAADARARRALACACTACRRAERRPLVGLIRTP